MAKHTPIQTDVTNQHLQNLDEQRDLIDLATYVSNSLPKQTTVDIVGGIFCHICASTYNNKKEYDDHYYNQHDKGEKLLYTCVVCHKQLTTYRSYRGHCYYMHVSRGRNKCEHCSKVFSKFSALRDHIKTMHHFECSTCNKQYTTKTDLQLHQIIHTDPSKNYCQVCETEIFTIDSCKDHIELHTINIYTCPICNENIPSKDTAGEHLAKHFENAGDKNTVDAVHKSDNKETSLESLGGIACCYCTVVFENRVEFDAHFSYDHGDKDIVYCCVVCGVTFEKYSVFREHAYNHYTKDKFCCTICQKTFNRLSMLATHMAACQTDAEASGKPFECPECGHRYGTDQRLRRHLQDVHGVHCIRCPVADCKKTFSTRKELILHQYVHTSHQNWCRQCGLLFTSLTSCERHLDVHKGTIYSCPICNKNYKEKYVLMKHIPQHFESTVHICKLCGKVFDNKRRFNHHLQTHSTEHNHNCTYCGKGFNTLSRLQQHLNTHTGSKPYKCTICSKTFASYPNWVKHMGRMHKLDKVNKENPTSDSGADEINNFESFDDIELTNKNSENNIDNLNLHQPGYNEKLMEIEHNVEFTKNDEKVLNNSSLHTSEYNENLMEINHKIGFTKNDENVLNNSNLHTSEYNENLMEINHKIGFTKHDENVLNNSNLHTSEYNENLMEINNKIGFTKNDENALNNSNLHTPEYNEKLLEIKHEIKFTKNDENVLNDSNLHTPEYNEKLLEINRNIKFINNNKIVDNYNLDMSEYNGNMIEMTHNIIPQTESDTKLSYVFPDQNSKMEAETIDQIDIEKELQIIENNAEKKIIGSFEFIDSSILDNANSEVPANIGPSEAVYPAEYGPEFTIGDSCGILDLDDHMLPHIDPLLTIKTEDYMTRNILLPPNMEAAMYQQYQGAQKWEPPVFTKVCPEYPYYGDMVDTNWLSMMNANIF